jgi:hypothetical protein
VVQHVARNVYINPDLAPAAAKLAYEARKKRRELKRHHQQNSDTANATGLVSQLANAPSSENNVLVVETTDVLQPNNTDTNRQFSNDQGRLQTGACVPTVHTAADENSFGFDLGLSRIADATGGGSGLPSSSSSSSSPSGHNSSPTDQAANVTHTANSFRIGLARKQ